MDILRLNYNNNLSLYEYSSNKRNFLTKVTHLLTVEIQGSQFYKKLLYQKPYEYIGDCDTLKLVDNYIVVGSLYNYDRDYLPLAKFENLMNQWRIAYADEPAEIIISIDYVKNFIITYEKDNKVIKPPSLSVSIKSPSYSGENPNDDNYIEIEPIYDELYVFETDDNRLNLFGYLLTSNIPSSDYLEKLQQPPYEYYDDRYYLAIVEDRILIYDKIKEIKVLPPYNKFLDLMKQWPIAESKKPRLIRIYIENDYDLRIFILQPVAKQ